MENTQSNFEKPTGESDLVSDISKVHSVYDNIVIVVEFIHMKYYMYVHQCECCVSWSKCLLRVNVHAPVSFYFCGVTKIVFNTIAELLYILNYMYMYNRK